MLTSARLASPVVPAAAPMTGTEYLESLRDDREVWIYGERVRDVTRHPAFRNSARMIARMYESLHDPARSAALTVPTDCGSGSFTHPFFRSSRSVADLTASRDAIAEWARIGYGWLGRSPDFKASFLGMLGSVADFFGEYAGNAQKLYGSVQSRVLHANHAIVNPPTDRNLPPDQIGDVCVRVERETDAGIVVSGAKVVATGSALTNLSFVGSFSALPVQSPEFALTFVVPTDAPGLKLICRPSYEMTAAVMGSPFDYPLSSRLDENDAILVLDKVFIPWEQVLIYRDPDRLKRFFPATRFVHRVALHGCTRLAVKLDFLAGLFHSATECIGSQTSRSVQAAVGELLAWRNLFHAMSTAMVQEPEVGPQDTLLPNGNYAFSYRILGPIAYNRIKQLIEETVASGLIYLNSNAADFQTAELRPYLDRYLRGSNGYSAEQRSKLMKLLWDAIGSEFGGRHELYELNYSGSQENMRIEMLLSSLANGQMAGCKDLVQQCMSEYSLDGWNAADLIGSQDVNLFGRPGIWQGPGR